MRLESPKSRVVNIKQMRQDIKVPFDPPRAYTTMYSGNFWSRQGNDEVGAFTKEGNSPNKLRKEPRGELQQDIDLTLPLQSITHNRMQYNAFTKMPEPNKKGKT